MNVGAEILLGASFVLFVIVHSREDALGLESKSKCKKAVLQTFCGRNGFTKGRKRRNDRKNTSTT